MGTIAGEMEGHSFTSRAAACRWSEAAAVSEGHQVATMRKSGTTLRTLPAPSDVVFPGLYGWSPVSSTGLTTALGIDPGIWNTWRNRRLTPAPLPAAWFRRASGSPLVYRVDHVLSWLAARRGEQLDTLDTWRLSLARDLDAETDDPHQVRKLACLYARAAGPVVGDVRLTPGGFAAYLDTLVAG